MTKWIAEFDLEDGDTMPEHMDLEYKGAKLDFHCRPKELCENKVIDEHYRKGFTNGIRTAEWRYDKIRAEIESQREEASKKHFEDEGLSNYYFGLNDGLKDARDIIDKYKAESEE